MSKWNRPMTTYKADAYGPFPTAAQRCAKTAPLTKTKAEREAARARLRAARAKVKA